jgi:hypothetical protein
MKLKSLLFGSAAVLAAGTGAQAADLPTVEPVEYVRICDAFGTGFYYIPGTDTCLKLSGYVRYESHFIEGFDEGDLSRRFGTRFDHQVNNWSTRVRGHVEWDARTQTDVGLIRAFIAIEGTRGPSPQTVAVVNVPDPTYGSGVTLASAFIQVSNDWGTYTAGKFGSFFDFFGSHLYGTRIGLEDGTTDPNLFAWTFAGGNGFSFSIASEDPKSTGRRKSKGLFDDYEGQEFPDGVANIRVDQGWGSAQIMGAIRHIHDKQQSFRDPVPGLPCSPGVPPVFACDAGEDADGIGWAVGAGLKLGIPGGWEIVGQAGYSQGAVGYVWSDGPAGFGDFQGPEAEDSQNLAWGGRGGIAGPIGNLRVWADGAFYHEELDTPILGRDGLDFVAAGVGAAWSPAPGLTFGPEVAWNSLDVDGGDFLDYDVWNVMWRVQRNF